MAKLSAGLLLYRPRPVAAAAGDEAPSTATAGEGRPVAATGWEVLLVHPGGPFWQRKDLGAWSIPKGEVAAGEDPLVTARRELTEETGFRADPPFAALAPVRQAGGKTVMAWAAAGDGDAAAIVSNTFDIEWPPGSGRRQSFPEVDRAGWFTVPEAARKILAGQRPLLEQLAALLAEAGAGSAMEDPR